MEYFINYSEFIQSYITIKKSGFEELFSIREMLGAIQNAILCLHYPNINMYIFVSWKKDSENCYQLYQLSTAA